MGRYYPTGVCARLIEAETDGETVLSVQIHGGCPGQAAALPRLLQGMRLEEAICRLRGVKCRNETSCADQIGRVLEIEREKARKKHETTIGERNGKPE